MHLMIKIIIFFINFPMKYKIKSKKINAGGEIYHIFFHLAITKIKYFAFYCNLLSRHTFRITTQYFFAYLGVINRIRYKQKNRCNNSIDLQCHACPKKRSVYPANRS